MRNLVKKYGGALLVAATLSSTSATAQLISDFETIRPLDNENGSWVGQIAVLSGFQVIGASGNPLQSGSAFTSFVGSPLDLSSSSALELTATRILGNSLGVWTIRLQSSDNGVTSYNFSPSSFPENPVAGSVTIPFSSGVVFAGAGVDLTDVVAFGLFGDGSSDSFKGGFGNLAAVPEPSLYALVSGLGLAAFAVARRRAKQVA